MTIRCRVRFRKLQKVITKCFKIEGGFKLTMVGLRSGLINELIS